MKADKDELIKMFQNNEEKYLLVNVISKRAREIIDGERPMVDANQDASPSEIAIKELLAGKIKVHPKKVRNKLVDIVQEVTDRR